MLVRMMAVAALSCGTVRTSHCHPLVAFIGHHDTIGISYNHAYTHSWQASGKVSFEQAQKRDGLHEVTLIFL